MWVNILGDDGDIHIIPKDDTVDHIINSSCLCNPSFDVLGIQIHNAKDNRELTEGKPYA